MAPQIHQPGPEESVDVGRGITVCAQRFGDPALPAVLLVPGLGQQLGSWPDGFCSALVEQGFQVIRFDNRDVGRSSRVPTPPPTPIQLVSRRFGAAQYVLADMAEDASRLLATLGIDAAHVVGISMGGMIGQTLAARHPEQVLSLVSIMSNTGARGSGGPARSTWLRMAKRPPSDRQAAIERSVALFRHIGSHGFPFDEAHVRGLAEVAHDRGQDPEGVGRQLAAILKSGDRTPEVRTITAPTLVIHGDRDRMVHPSGGAATAAAIPGARHETIVGLGHDLPAGAHERIVGLIAGHAKAAQLDGARA